MKEQVNKEQTDKQMQLAVIYLRILKNAFDEPTRLHQFFFSHYFYQHFWSFDEF